MPLILVFYLYNFLFDVPFDPYLPHLFQGEEILLAARAWTNGWDLYNLSKPVITHYYNREKDNQPHFYLLKKQVFSLFLPYREKQ